MKKLVFYGAGQVAEREMKRADLSGYEAVCFCDSDEKKHGTELCGLPVMGLADARERFGDFDVFVTTGNKNKVAIFDYLTGSGVSRGRIVNFTEARIGCYALKNYLFFSEIGMWSCCFLPTNGGIAQPPGMEWNGRTTAKTPGGGGH